MLFVVFGFYVISKCGFVFVCLCFLFLFWFGFVFVRFCFCVFPVQCMSRFPGFLLVSVCASAGSNNRDVVFAIVLVQRVGQHRLLFVCAIMHTVSLPRE